MDNDKKNISFLAFEAEMTRYERVIKRLWLVIIGLICAVALTNIIWLFVR